jgi:RNA polymerase sigma-19 factor, ECF subfamily
MDLIDRLRHGDPDALEALFREHRAALRSFALRFVSEDEADDVVQDVFLALWRGRLRIRTTLRAWLFAAVRNTALKRVRHGSVVSRLGPRLADVGGAPAGMGQPAPDPDATVVRGEDMAFLDAAVAALPPRARTAIELRYHHQMKHAEVAEAMGISVKGVEKLLASAIRTLRGKISN